MWSADSTYSWRIRVLNVEYRDLDCASALNAVFSSTRYVRTPQTLTKFEKKIYIFSRDERLRGRLTRQKNKSPVSHRKTSSSERFWKKTSSRCSCPKSTKFCQKTDVGAEKYRPVSDRKHMRRNENSARLSSMYCGSTSPNVAILMLDEKRTELWVSQLSGLSVQHVKYTRFHAFWRAWFHPSSKAPN